MDRTLKLNSFMTTNENLWQHIRYRRIIRRENEIEQIAYLAIIFFYFNMGLNQELFFNVDKQYMKMNSNLLALNLYGLQNLENVEILSWMKITQEDRLQSQEIW